MYICGDLLEFIFHYIVYIYTYTYKTRFVMASENSEIMQFQVTIATNCRVLTRSMNVSYIVGHEQVSICCF
jgi:hypothetical protein